MRLFVLVSAFWGIVCAALSEPLWALVPIWVSLIVGQLLGNRAQIRAGRALGYGGFWTAALNWLIIAALSSVPAYFIAAFVKSKLGN